MPAAPWTLPSIRPSGTRLLVPALVLFALLLTACSPSSGTGDAAPGGEASGAGAGSGTRSVEHARGTTEVPDVPQRVVVLEPVQLDTTVALGVIPVGAAVLSEATGIPAYLGAEAAEVPLVGTVPEPDLERIAATSPDLILGTESRHAALYEQLSAIAPTVFLANHADPWQDNVLAVGEALGRTAEADQLLTDYRTRCEEVAAQVPDGATAQLIRPRDGQLTLYGPTSFAGSTLECAGYTTPERDWEGSISVDVSYERAAEARADLIVVTSATPDDPASIPPILAQQNFASLEIVDQAVWITGVGPLGGQRVLDEIERLATTD